VQRVHVNDEVVVVNMFDELDATACGLSFLYLRARTCCWTDM
jgi:hypothetical protein